jgi:VIT1/CCC1 family predicted Fe2+/Mn2+ transporter
VLPFVFIADAYRALRVSNAVAIAMLFACGVIMARHAGMRTIRTGLAMVGVGVVLVLITMALGG